MIGKLVQTIECCNNRCKFNLQAMLAARVEGHKECEYPLNTFYEQKPISSRQLWAPTQPCRVRVPNPLAQKQVRRAKLIKVALSRFPLTRTRSPCPAVGQKPAQVRDENKQTTVSHVVHHVLNNLTSPEIGPSRCARNTL